MDERSLSFWMTDKVSVDSQLFLFLDNCRLCVWRLYNQEFDIKRLQPTVKHGGYCVMVWGGIHSDGLSELVEFQENITSFKYFYIAGRLPSNILKW